MLEFSSL